MNTVYWARHPDGPFATLIAVAATYCSPDAYNGAYEDLTSRARSPEVDDDEIHAFKAELKEALADPASCLAMNCPTPSNTTTAATRLSSTGYGVTCTAMSQPPNPDPPADRRLTRQCGCTVETAK